MCRVHAQAFHGEQHLAAVDDEGIQRAQLLLTPLHSSYHDQHVHLGGDRVPGEVLVQGIVAGESGLQGVEVVVQGPPWLPDDHAHDQTPAGEHLSHREAERILQSVGGEDRRKRRVPVQLVDRDPGIDVDGSLLVLLDDLDLLGKNAEAARAFPLPGLLRVQNRDDEPAP